MDECSSRLTVMDETPPVVLTVAGFDPSSGAGVTADLKTIAAHGCYGVACITALTVQSTKGVRRVAPVAGDLIQETMEELSADFKIAAVHIGMLASRQIVQVVSDFLTRRQLPNVVLDPVLRSSSGAELLDSAGTRLLAERLRPAATVTTPNLDEASVLAGMAVSNLEQMRAAAEKLHVMGAKAVVITGGHLDPAIDLLSCVGDGGVMQREFSGPHQPSGSTHGTGCAFASALACELATGRLVQEAVPLAKAYVAAAIANAYPLGEGIGPVNHLYRFGRARRGLQL
jgi:hydroxymethylpyrimidine/phosphomethylpyrimidine kinase